MNKAVGSCGETNRLLLLGNLSTLERRQLFDACPLYSDANSLSAIVSLVVVPEIPMKRNRLPSLLIPCVLIGGIIAPPLVVALIAQPQTQSGYRIFRTLDYVVRFPVDWFVNLTPNDYLTLTSHISKVGDGERTAPEQLIRTEISVAPESFESIVRRKSQGTTTLDGSRIVQRGATILGGQDAYRVWMTNTQFYFPDQMATYVRYTPTQTIEIVSYYTASNPSAVPMIQQIHGSLRLVQP